MRSWKKLVTLEDWWAVWIGFLVLGAAFLGAVSAVPKIPRWETPGEVLAAVPGVPLLLLMIGLGGLSVLAVGAIQRQAGRFAAGFPVLFLLALLSFLVAGNRSLAAYGLSYALWALLIGLAWSNLLGVPSWLKPAVRSELFIKTGLVILGAEIIFGNILTLGRYGVIVAWGVTPVILVSMFWFGYRRLKLAPSFAVTIAAATSVCGVSAAIAAAGASKAKKEELTLAVAMTLIFTVLMMVLMPLVCRWLDLDTIVAGAWLGGTIRLHRRSGGCGTDVGRPIHAGGCGDQDDSKRFHWPGSPLDRPLLGHTSGAKRGPSVPERSRSGIGFPNSSWVSLQPLAWFRS